MEHSNLKIIDIGIGEAGASTDKDTAFVVYGVGSCVVVCMYDPDVPVAGVAHILLPKKNTSVDDVRESIYADVAVPELVKEMKKLGAKDKRLRANIAGGANVVKAFSGEKQDIGLRNVEETRRILREMRISIASEDVCGTKSRKVMFYVKSGEMVISSRARRSGGKQREGRHDR